MKESYECLFYKYFLRRFKFVYLGCNFVIKRGIVFLKLVLILIDIIYFVCVCGVLFLYKLYVYI